jgi:hypothetical protein
MSIDYNKKPVVDDEAGKMNETCGSIATFWVRISR